MQRKEPQSRCARSKSGDGVRILSMAPLDDPNEPLASAIVRRGRSVHAPIEGAERERIGYDVAGGQYVFRQPQQLFGPGETVTLKRSEIRRLRELGCFEDDDADQTNNGAHPK